MPASTATAATPSGGVPPIVVPVKSEPFDLMGPSLMLNAQPESSSPPIAPQLKSRADMPQVYASGVPDQMTRHDLPEGIVFVRQNNLGLATQEELARAAVNGTLLDLVSVEPTRYPWLSGKHTGEQSFSLRSHRHMQSQAEGSRSSTPLFCVQESVQGQLPIFKTDKALSPTATLSQTTFQAFIPNTIPSPMVANALRHNPSPCCIVGQNIVQE